MALNLIFQRIKEIKSEKANLSMGQQYSKKKTQKAI